MGHLYHGYVTVITRGYHELAIQNHGTPGAKAPGGWFFPNHMVLITHHGKIPQWSLFPYSYGPRSIFGI